MKTTAKRQNVAPRRAQRPTLKEWYVTHVARLRAENKPILTYVCPCCAENIDVQRPNAGEIWDSMNICPHCDGMHFRISYGDAGRVEATAVDIK